MKKKIIRNTELLSKLKKTAISEKDNPNVIEKLWACLFDEDGYLIDDETPVLVGGLSHINVTKNQVTFFDIGCSSNGTIKDNSFAIRRNLK